MPALTQFNPNGAPAFLLEEKSRLSDSVLWKMQREYFQRAGLNAWSKGTVPHYVTSNAAFAEACAAVVFGFLCDCFTHDGGETKPVNILELGAGSGRFGYLFLKALSRLRSESPGCAAPFRYIMTDCVDSNVTWYRSHAALQPYVDQGLLEFTPFDVTRDSELRLPAAQETLPPRLNSSAMVVLANYFLDGIPHDVFLVREGRIFEGLYSLYSDRPKTEISPGDPLEHLQYDCSFRPVEGRYYNNSLWDDILRRYAREFNDLTLVFPSSALACIDRLLGSCDGRFLLLSTDKGQHLRDLEGQAGLPGIETHGSISMSVNYHAISEYVAALGGLPMLLSHPHAHINTAAFLLGGDPTEFKHSQFAYRRSIDLFGPDDFYTLRSSLREQYPYLGLDALVSLIRLSRCDPRILSECLPGLQTHLPTSSVAVKEEVRRLALQSWDNYFYIGEEEDLAFDIARFLYLMECYEDALRLLEQSCRLWGPDTATFWNMGLCHYSLGQPEAAAEWFRQAYALDATFKPGAAFKHKEHTG
jgi:tetratricopeptide (TPR) repeat protein